MVNNEFFSISDNDDSLFMSLDESHAMGLDDGLCIAIDLIHSEFPECAYIADYLEKQRERRKIMVADLINRQTLLAQMEAQKQAYDFEAAEGGEIVVAEPSWELAISMIEDMPKEVK